MGVHLFSLLWCHPVKLVVAPYNAQHVEQLSLVLVYSLHLCVDTDCVRGAEAVPECHNEIEGALLYTDSG